MNIYFLFLFNDFVEQITIHFLIFEMYPNILYITLI